MRLQSDREHVGGLSRVWDACEVSNQIFAGEHSRIGVCEKGFSHKPPAYTCRGSMSAFPLACSALAWAISAFIWALRAARV